MQQPVENSKQEKNSILSAPVGINQQRRINLERLVYFQPSDYSFESFMDMCEIFEPKWFRITSRKKEVAIQYAQTKHKIFFAHGKTFAEAFHCLMWSLRQKK